MLVPILAIIKSKPQLKYIDIAMISRTVHHAVYCGKWAILFAAYRRHIQYQAEKKSTAETHAKNILVEEYSDFLIFSQKKLRHPPSTLKVWSKNSTATEQKPGHASLYEMFLTNVILSNDILTLI